MAISSFAGRRGVKPIAMSKPRFLRLLSLLLIAGASHAADFSAWDSSYDATAKSRFIPVELWTGAAWDGQRDLAMTDASLSFGKRGEKRIVGPIAWTRPGGETVAVYQRDNRGKKQLFALSSRRDGLGRVYDSRYGRDCIDEVKFPLGIWREGETSIFDVACNGGKLRRRIALTIERIDFVNNGVPHSLQYHWVVDDGKQSGTDVHYVYSPGLGLVWIDEN